MADQSASRDTRRAFRICLVNPPFAALASPSFALTQLQELLRTGDDRTRLDVSIHYLNLDFARAVGYELYTFIADSMEALNCGIGEWMFRRAAFPEAPDNADEYVARYGHHLRRADGSSWWPEVLKARADLDALLDALIVHHDLHRADLIGFTSMFAQNAPSFALARKLKAREPHLLTVIGGANCEWPMGDEIAKQVDAIDYVFSGPALVSFPQFVTAWLDGDLRRIGGGVIQGVIANASRRRASTAPSPAKLRMLDADARTGMENGKPSIGRQLDIDRPIALHYEEFLGVVSRAFPNRVSPILFFETSRGCWWGEKAHCTFCGLNGSSMAYRAMDAALAIEQFRSLFRYSGLVAELQCVDNIMPRSYVADVLPHLDTPPGMRIFYEVKADLSENDLRALAKARVTKIQPGIESLATSTLKLMRKGTTALQNIQFLKHCAVYGIEPWWNMLIGFPGEAQDVYRKYVADLPALVHLPPPSGVFPVRFDRFSPYFTRSADYGLRLQPLDFYALVYPFPRDAIARLAYFFSDENVLAPYAIAAGTWINRLRERVRVWREGWRLAKRGAPPSLRFESERSPVVIDTRSGELVAHDVGDAGRAVLECLSKPRRVDDVVRQLSGDRRIDVAAEIERATHKRLLFEEDGRLISLVCSDAPVTRPESPFAHDVHETAFA